MKHTRAKEVRLAIGALAVLILFAASASVRVAVMLTVARLTPTRTVLNLKGSEAAARGWPARTPHAHAWPEPTAWAVRSAWAGHRRSKGWAQTWGYDTHSVQVDLSGWPLPVPRNVRVWWVWDDPAWVTTAQSDRGLGLAWSGVVVNPLLVGGGLWVGLVSLPVGAVIVRRAVWARRGLWVCCAYPVGASRLCTECGRAVVARVG